jgi:hypothetical protein
LNLSKSSEDKFPSLTSSISSTNTVKVDKEELKDKNVNVDMDTGGRKKPTVVSLDDCMQAMDDELYGDDDGTTGVIKKGSLVGTSFSRLNEENDDEVEEEEVVEEEEEEDEDNNYTNDDRSGSSKTQRKRPKKGDSGMHETEKGQGGRRRVEGRGGGGLLSEDDATYNFLTSMSSAVAAQGGTGGPASTLITSGLQVEVPKEWWKGKT